jgi:hypothetical protein
MGAGRFVRGVKKQVRDSKKKPKKNGEKRRFSPGVSAQRDKPKPKKSKADDGAPVVTYDDGTQLVGEYGKRLARTKGDFKEINKTVYEIKKQTRLERDRITDDLRGFMNSQQRQDYLDQVWINNENRIDDLRSQYLLYGKNSVQGRLLDQRIKGAVNLQNHVERLAGVRNDRDGYQDYFAIPRPDGRKKVRGIDRFGRSIDSRRGELPPVPYKGSWQYVNRRIKQDMEKGIYYSNVDYNYAPENNF